MPEGQMDISDAAKSGDGSLEMVGIKINGKFKSPVTNQTFDTKKALDLHLKYLHDPKRASTLEENALPVFELRAEDPKNLPVFELRAEDPKNHLAAAAEFSRFVLTDSPNCEGEWQTYLDLQLVKADGMVACGQALNRDGTAPRTLEFRVAATAALHHYATQILRIRRSFPIMCTGGDPVKSGTSEARVMKRMLVDKGVPAADVVLEELSRTSMENAYFAMEVLTAQRRATLERWGEQTPIKRNLTLVFVTSEFHTPRALYCFDACFADAKARELTGFDFDVKLLALPCKSGCPTVQTISDEEMGPRLNKRINEQTLRQRLLGETRFVKEEMIPNLARHVKGGEVKIAPLSEERTQAAIQQVHDLIQVVKQEL